MARYRITLTIGSTSWTRVQSDPADLSSGVEIADTLRVAWRFPDGPWPSQPDPVEAAVGLITDDVSNLTWIAVGDPVSIVGDTLETTPVEWVRFHGRVAEVTMTPIPRGENDPWALFTVQAVDYTVDPADQPVTVAARSSESVEDRLGAIIDAAAVAGFTVAAPAAYPVGTLAAADAVEGNLVPLLDDVLMQTAEVPGHEGFARLVVSPEVAAGAFVGFQLVPVVGIIEDTDLIDGLPGRLVWSDGLLVLDVTSTGDAVPANLVELGTTWARTKESDVQAVEVSGAFGSVTVSRPGGTVTRHLESDLTVEADAAVVAAMYLPDAGSTFTARGLVYRPAEPADLAGWFPDPTASGAPRAYVMPVVVAGLVSTVDVNGRGYYAGQLSTVDLIIDQGQILVSFAIRPNLPRVAAAGVASNLLAALDADASTFEGGLGGWTVSGTPAPAVAQDDEHVYAGAQAMKITWAGAGTFPQAQRALSGMTAGATYTVSARCYVPTGSPDFRVLGGTTVGDLVTIKDQWVRVSLTFTAGSSTPSIGFRSPADPAGAAMWVDEVTVVAGSSVDVGNQVTFNAVADEFPTAQIQDVHPDVTFYELRLARRS